MQHTVTDLRMSFHLMLVWSRHSTDRPPVLHSWHISVHIGHCPSYTDHSLQITQESIVTCHSKYFLEHRRFEKAILFLTVSKVPSKIPYCTFMRFCRLERHVLHQSMQCLLNTTILNRSMKVIKIRNSTQKQLLLKSKWQIIILMNIEVNSLQYEYRIQ